MITSVDRPAADITPADRPPRTTTPDRSGVRMAGAVITVLAVVMLAFLAQLTVVSQLRYERAQQLALADLRTELAEGTAPVGQTDFRGRLLEPGAALAVLRIPALGVEQVVLEGTSAEVLQDGPGHRRDTALPGQSGTSVLMGRRAAYGGPFYGVPLLRVGDAISVTTGQGTHEFRVRAVRRPGDPVPPTPAAGTGRLTLITADGSPYLPTDVVRVDADLVTPVQPAGPVSIGPSSLRASEAALAVDSDVWVPLVLWGQGLVLAALALSWARIRWGGRQAWVVGFPVIGALGMTVADHAARLLPNLT